MIFPDEMFDNHLNYLLTKSEPGDMLHTLIIVAAKPGATTALGLADPDQLHTSLIAIEPDGPSPTRMVGKTIVAAQIEAIGEGCEIQFIGLGLEMMTVPMLKDGDEVRENRIRRMQGDWQLHEHPEAVEATLLYAACRDGRRWTGQRYLTGPQAGKTMGPKLLVGALAPEDQGPSKKYIRQAVGLRS